VLQKVCHAVKAKVKSEDLNDRCNLLGNPDSLKAIQSAKTAPTTQPAKVAAPAPQPAASEPAPVVEQPKEQKATPAPAPAPVATAPATVPAATSAEYWTLQLGAFGTKANADLLVTNLKKQKITCTVIEQPRGERTLYLVQTGRFETKDQAVDFAANKLAPLKIEFQPLLKR
jgi:cell division septation protein DedD